MAIGVLTSHSVLPGMGVAPMLVREDDDVRKTVHGMVDDLVPFDQLEAEHRLDVLAWLSTSAEIFRTAKPATPPKHLVSYCVLIDRATENVLLVDHRDAQLWLPTGGHIEPEEHPASAARREMYEELQISPDFLVGEAPLLVTVTQTAGMSASHTDVSLWFAFEGSVGDAISPDDGEFADVRWWAFDSIRPGPKTRFDPHLPRFVLKLRHQLA